MTYPRIATLKTADAFRAHLTASGIPLAFDDRLAAPAASPLAQPIEVDGVRVGNRFCILPMEGWDGTADGEPTDLTRRRWRHFGTSGAKLMWGGEAVAIRHDGRANPNQLLITPRNLPAIASLREELVRAHRDRFGAAADADLFVGLQLTHSGRYARPNVYDRPEPLAGWHHPLLDRRFAGGVRVLSDAELDRLADEFIAAAALARDAGFTFVDVKQCHGYLGHELLGARGRSGPYGGTLENRTRFLRHVVEGIRAQVPELTIVVRLSVFDTVPYRKRGDGVGEAESQGDSFGFGVLESDDQLEAALEECRAVLSLLEKLGVRWICTTAGSPYYNPHVQRPAFFPPLDGYEPPEDPLRGVARQIRATALLKRQFPAAGLRRIGVQLSAGVAAACRPARRGERPDGLRRPWPHRAVVSRSAGRRAGGRAAEARGFLPDVQRLHDRSAHGAGLRVLPARQVLRGAAGGGQDPGSAGA
jgi:2,4-dienoyl-CoA reductase-like NADH-dependent reductase (Old Yellow Enzyme family)